METIDPSEPIGTQEVSLLVSNMLNVCLILTWKDFPAIEANLIGISRVVKLLGMITERAHRDAVR